MSSQDEANTINVGPENFKIVEEQERNLKIAFVDMLDNLM